MRCLRLVVIEIISPVNNSESKGALSVNFSSIAIEINVPRDEFSSIVIELTFVALRRGFKKAGSVLFHIGDSWDKAFLNPIYISLYLHNWAVLRLCIHSAKVLIGHLKFSVFEQNGVISRKSLHLVERCFILDMSNQTIILIGQLPQLRWREKKWIPLSCQLAPNHTIHMT